MTITASAISKYIRITPTKIIPVISQIRGKNYKDSLVILKTIPTKKKFIVWKTLHSAVSNLIKIKNIDKENIYISNAFVTKGTMLKRIQPHAKGKAFRIEKKFSHITITVKERENTLIKL